MLLQGLAFYLLSAVAVVSALLVVTARNPVHSVLWLILAFFSSAGLFVLMGAEFLAMLLVVVYVGAVAVLFLFVVMMLDVDFVELKQGFLNYLPIGGAVAGLVVVELILAFAAWSMPSDDALARAHPVATAGSALAKPGAPGNVEGLGLVLYTDFVHYFQIAGIILLVAMIGAIVLTFRTREGVRKQDPAAQVARRREASVELKKVKTGQGI